MARHCTWCNGKGHNKRTCGTYTDHLKRYYERSDKPSPTADYYERLLERRGIDATTGEKMTTKQKQARNDYAKQARRCTYCNGEGHNSRTCPALKVDKELVVEYETEFKIAVSANIKEGRYPTRGSIISFQHNREYHRGAYHEVHDLHLVTGMSWSHLTLANAHQSRGEFLSMVPLSGKSRTCYNQLQVLLSDGKRRFGAKENEQKGWAVVSNAPAEAEARWEEPPAQWWESTVLDDKYYFETGRERNATLMRILAKALAVAKSGEEIDLTAPSTAYNQLRELLGDEWDPYSDGYDEDKEKKWK